MTLAFSIISIILWCCIGIIILRDDENAFRALVIIADNAPWLGLSALFIYVILWPIANIALRLMVWMIAKVELND